MCARLPLAYRFRATWGLAMSIAVETGLERLLADACRLLRDRRVGLVAGPSAVTRDLTGAAKALLAAGVHLTALFAAEHGLYGAAAAGVAVGHARDARTGLPVFSLYGETQEPTPEMLAGVDLLAFDMQDVGARFYTFFSTLFRVLQAGARHGRPVVVLDRPNPITGLAVGGPLLDPALQSFVGLLPVPVRHGLTMGELARLACATCRIPAELTVVPMAGWRRELWFDQTGLPWVPPSPAMPHLSTATLYPGLCLLEGTNLSEGRGTALPFEICGAPWLDGHELAGALNALGLGGVRFRSIRFTPTAGKHAGEACGGVQAHVTGRQALRPVEAGLHLIAAARAQAPERFAFLAPPGEGQAPYFDLLAGTSGLREGVAAGVPVEELARRWAGDLSDFLQARRSCLLYD